MARFKFLFFYILLFSALACRAVSGIGAAEPTVTAYPSATMRPLPTVTPKPAQDRQELASPTPVTAPTESAEATLEVPVTLPTDMSIIPMGTPYLEDSFHGVPVMPGAQNPSEENDTLTFTTQASIDETLKFYQDALKADGWQFLGGDVETPESKMAIYTKGDRTATIAIMPNPMNPGETMVFLAVP